MEKVAERAEPKRWLTKQEGARHLIHASIRLIIAEEDPFAVNVLIHSAEKVLTDLFKHAGSDDPYSFEHLLVPKHKKEFFAIYREPYNFLKHADKDHDGKLPVYGIVRSNDVVLLTCIVRYQKLFSELTIHMQRFLTLCLICYPHLINWPTIPGIDVPTTHLSDLGRIPRGDLLKTMCEATSQERLFLEERSQDLIDISEANASLART